jgi:hypothetical protein
LSLKKILNTNSFENKLYVFFEDKQYKKFEITDDFNSIPLGYVFSCLAESDDEAVEQFKKNKLK